MRGNKVLTIEQKVDILHTYYKLQVEALEKSLRNPTSKKVAARAQIRTAEILGYGKVTVNRIVKDWKEGVLEQKRRGGDESKAYLLRIGNHPRIYTIVRDFVLERQRTTERTVAEDLVTLLAKEKFITVDQSNATSMASAIRCMNRWLERHDFERGLAGRKSIEEMGHMRQKRADYLFALQANRGKGPGALREVYLDESYVHEHHNALKHTISLQQGAEGSAVRLKMKGRRFCFIAAIQGKDPRARSAARDQRTPNQRPGLVPGSLWYFESVKERKRATPAVTQSDCTQPAEPASQQQAKKGRKRKYVCDSGSGDYHSAFNASNFMGWFKDTLLPKLTEANGAEQKYLFIMDNAAYHKTRDPNCLGVQQMNKEQLLAIIRREGLTHPRFHVQLDRSPMLVLRSAVQTFMQRGQEEMIAIVQYARSLGHDVLYTPPYHSDFQPIEYLWAEVKGKVARQYTNETRLGDVEARLKNAFKEVQDNHDFVTKIIRKCYGTAKSIVDKDIQSEEGRQAGSATQQASSEQEENFQESDSEEEDSSSDFELPSNDEEGEDESDDDSESFTNDDNNDGDVDSDDADDDDEDEEDDEDDEDGIE